MFSEANVCLIYPRFSPDGNPPLGLAYIAAVLEENGIKVNIIDCTFGFTFDKAIKKVLKSNPSIVGIYASTPLFHTALKIARVLKKKSDVITCLGGPHPTMCPKEVILNPEVDFVVYGEGELTFLELVKALMEGHGDFKNIESILFKENDKVIINPPRPPTKNLDLLPFPARHLLPMYAYMAFRYLFHGFPATTLVASRGCPFHCTFCQPGLSMIFGRGVRWRSPKNIVDEIEHLVERYGVKGVIFHDDTFTINKRWVTTICDEIVSRGLKIKWICNSRADTLNGSILLKMREAGCIELRIGVESGNQWVLDNVLKKGITIDQVKHAFKLAKKHGMRAWAFFMVGSPGETYEMALESIKLAREIRPDHANISITIPLPGTELWDITKKYGTVNKDWSKYVYSSDYTTIETPLFSKCEVEELANRFRKEFMVQKKLIFKVSVGLRILKCIGWSLYRSMITRSAKPVTSIIRLMYDLVKTRLLKGWIW